MSAFAIDTSIAEDFRAAWGISDARAARGEANI